MRERSTVVNPTSGNTLGTGCFDSERFRFAISFCAQHDKTVGTRSQYVFSSVVSKRHHQARLRTIQMNDLRSGRLLQHKLIIPQRTVDLQL
jgi:hypothetical protein